MPVAIASDNTRDQFYAYGDLDMLEVFNQVRGVDEGGQEKQNYACVIRTYVNKAFARSARSGLSRSGACLAALSIMHFSLPCQGCRMAHLDRPYSDWPLSVTATPADAMHLPRHGRLAVGGPADFVIFRGRRYSELLSRPQYDRVRSPPLHHHHIRVRHVGLAKCSTNMVAS